MGVCNAKGDLDFELAISVVEVRFTVDEESGRKVADYMAEADERLYEMKRRRKGSRSYSG